MFLLAFFSIISFGQTPEAMFTNIQDNEVDVSTSPILTIQTNMSIDTSSFRISYEKLTSDTTGLYYDSLSGIWLTSANDSLIMIYEDAPNIFIINEEDYLTIPDSAWGQNSNSGIAEILSDTTIQFKSWMLNHNKKYYAVIQNLKVIDNQNDTLICPTEIISFTTQSLPFKLAKTNLYNGFLNCNDTLRFDFNRKIDSLSYFIGDLIDIQEITSVDTSGNGLIENLTQLNSNYWFNNDSTSIFVQPNGLIPGTWYYAKVNLKYLTGDSLDNSSHQFKTLSHYQINISTDGVDYKIPPLMLDSISVELEDTVKLSAFEYYKGKMFEKWICEDDSVINNSTNLELVISKDCATAKNLNIIAKYNEVKDTVIINTDPIYSQYMIVNVYDIEGNYLGAEGQYLIDPYETPQLRVEIETDEGYALDYWTSSSGPWDDNKMKEIVITGGYGDIILDPNLRIIQSEYFIGIYVKFDNEINSRYDDLHRIEDVIDVSPAMAEFDPDGLWMRVEFEEDQPFSKNVLAQITGYPFDGCDCYRIYSVKGDVSNSFESDFCASPIDGPFQEIWGETISVDAQKKHKYVTISVDRKLMRLEAEMIVENNVYLPKSRDDARIEIEPHFPHIDGCQLEEGRLISSYRNDEKESFTYVYKCPQDVNIKTFTNEELITFDQYNTNFGFYGGSTPENELLEINPMCEHYFNNTNNKIQAILNDKFRLVEIGCYSAVGRGVPTWKYFKTDLFTSDDPNVNLFNYSLFNYIDPKRVLYLDPNEETVIIECKFNKDVDRSTINNTTNLLFWDITDRIDFPINGFKSFYLANNLTNYQWIDDRTIRIPLKLDLIKVPKYQVLGFRWNSDIKATDGTTLKNPNEIELLTEYPDLYVNQYQHKWKGDSDIEDSWWKAEFLSHYFLVWRYENDQQIYYGKTPTEDFYAGLAWNKYEWKSSDYNIFVGEINSHKKMGEYEFWFGTNWYESDIGSIAEKESEILQKYYDEYHEPNGGDYAMQLGNLQNAMHNISKPYLYYLGSRLSDDWYGGGPSTSKVGFGERFGSDSRWGTSLGWNQFYIDQIFNTNNIQVRMKYELK